MSLHNCKNCGKLYLKTKSEYCPECQSVNHEYYTAVRDYLRQNPRSSVMEIHAKTGIPVDMLTKLYKDNAVFYGI